MTQKGSINHNAKLTESDVVAIRAAYKIRVESSARKLAARYNVSKSQIEKIITRKNWRHVP